MSNTFDQHIDGYKEEMVQKLSELVQIPSVKGESTDDCPFGKEVARALQYTLDLGKELGFKTVKNVDGYAGYIEAGEGEELIGVLTHLDVVPAAGGWSVEPFGGEVKDNRVYGRGATDNKGPVISSVYALKALLDSGVDFKRRVRIIFGCDEETGMACMRHYTKVEEVPGYSFSPDAEYPLINVEKGIFSISLKKEYTPGTYGTKIKSITAGTRSNLVPDEAHMHLVSEDMETDRAILEDAALHFGYNLTIEKEPSGLHVICKGKSAHASRPADGENALGQLLETTQRLEKSDDGLLACAQQLGHYFGNTYDGKRACINFEDDISGAMAVNLGTMTADQYGMELKMDLRAPISVSAKQVADTLQEQLKKTGIKVVLNFESPGHHVPEEHPLVQKLLAAYHEKTGNETYCMALGGGTYARMFLNKAVAFGPSFPGKPALYHVPDEYHDIDELVLNGKIFAKALHALACEEWEVEK